MGNLARNMAAALVGATATLATRQALESTQPGGAEYWIRTNHRGEPITLMEGPAVAVGAATGALVAGSRSGAGRVAGAVASLGAGAFGLYDDLEEDTSVRSKGLKGHLGALAKGQLTTGGLKVVGIGATAFAAAALSARTRPQTKAVDVVLDTVVIAGSANLVNLLDLRPGRALKATSVAGAATMLAGAPGGAAILGSAVAAFPEDLAERGMLGDSGANALGALAGTSFVQVAPRGVRFFGAAVIVGLTLASEKVSFSKVIAGNKYLNAIDMLGRRPAHEAAGDDDGLDGALAGTDPAERTTDS